MPRPLALKLARTAKFWALHSSFSNRSMRDLCCRAYGVTISVCLLLSADGTSDLSGHIQASIRDANFNFLPRLWTCHPLNPDGSRRIRIWRAAFPMIFAYGLMSFVVGRIVSLRVRRGVRLAAMGAFLAICGSFTFAHPRLDL